MITWLQIWTVILHGLFGQATIPWPGTGVPVTPPPLSGMVLWYETDFGSNCSSSACTDGASQDTWADKSGNANNGGTGSKLDPTAAACVASVYHTNQINGKPAVTMTGITASPTCYTFTTPLTETVSSAFAVVKAANTSNESPILGGGGNSVDWNFVNPRLSAVCGSTILSGTTGADTSWHQFNYTYNASTGAAAMRLDRAADGSATTIVSITAHNTGIGGWSCGFSTHAYFQGQMAAFIWYNRVLSGAEITTVETYLHSKYGL